ncbi:hypothetical protein GQ600_26723 [Phytophthora cactorum]|nr:hypothetical protein GQ600_26723 [Phytophthora cactorum]
MFSNKQLALFYFKLSWTNTEAIIAYYRCRCWLVGNRHLAPTGATSRSTSRHSAPTTLRSWARQLRLRQAHSSMVQAKQPHPVWLDAIHES